MHQSAIRNFLRRLTAGDCALADDLAQETFLKAYQNINRFSFTGKFISWLFQIAYHQFIDDIRRNKKHNNDIPLTETITEISNNETEELLNSLTLDKCLQQLSELEQAMLSLNYQLGMTQNEISEILKVPLGTVKTTLRRSKHKLLAMMSPSINTAEKVEVTNYE